MVNNPIDDIALIVGARPNFVKAAAILDAFATVPSVRIRMVTDSISDLLLCSEPAGVKNLTREGHPAERVRLVGNVMIDTLRRYEATARQSGSHGSLPRCCVTKPVRVLWSPFERRAESLVGICAWSNFGALHC